MTVSIFNRTAPYGQGKRIKIQSNYECLQVRHSCKAQGGESAKGTNRTLGKHRQKRLEFFQERHSQRAFALCRCGSWLCIRWESTTPTELKKCVKTINPGLAPWAMQEYHPYRAPLRLPNHFIILMRLPCKTYCKMNKKSSAKSDTANDNIYL